MTGLLVMVEEGSACELEILTTRHSSSSRNYNKLLKVEFVSTQFNESVLGRLQKAINFFVLFSNFGLFIAWT